MIVCQQQNLVSNGFCNDETNIEECAYDGGDCCGDCIVKDYCTNCSCIEDFKTKNVLVGNGVCNDETNVAECDYDEGDCCLSSLSSNFKCRQIK